MHITDWLEMLGEHFLLGVTGCTRIKNGAHSGGQMRFCCTTWLDRAMTYALSCVSTTCCRSVRQAICRACSV